MAVAITTTALPRAVRGQPYSAAIQAFGGTTPYVWEIQSGTLPDGLTFVSVNNEGYLSGAPTGLTPAAGNAITFVVTDAIPNTDSVPLTLIVEDTAVGEVPEITDQQWNEFWNCVGTAGYKDNIKQLFGEWAAQFNPNVSIASKAYDDLKNKKQAIDFLICLNRFLNSELVDLSADLTGKLNAVEACLVDNYSVNGYRISLSLQEALNLVTSSLGDVGDQYTNAVAQQTVVENQIAQVERRGTIARDLQALVEGSPAIAYIVKYKTDRDTYAAGEIITFTLKTTLPTTLLNCWIPRDDGEPPFFLEITDINQVDPQNFIVRVLVPEDYRGGNFRVKFQLVADNSASCLFFQHFDPVGIPSAPAHRKYKVRPCPPAP